MKNYKHSKIIAEISKKLGINKSVVNIVINQFYNGLRRYLQNNEEVNINKKKVQKKILILLVFLKYIFKFK